MASSGNPASSSNPLQSRLAGAPSPEFSVPPQDLSGDPLLREAPRKEVAGRQAPVLGGIALLAKLGQGSSGAVYLGIHPRLNREVAVRLIALDRFKTGGTGASSAQLPNGPAALPAPAGLDAAALERVILQVQTASNVQSPNLVNVLDVNQEGDLFYLVMEYVHGITAQQFLKQAPGARLSEADALTICIAAAEGLAAAHAAGVNHGCVKPANILLPKTRAGQPVLRQAKLADLGMGRADNSQTVGMAGYAAPEHLKDPGSVRAPADVFSLGATLYALLAGRAPFKEKTFFWTLKATCDSPHVPLRQPRPDASGATAHLIDVCLAKDPDKRYPDASALLAALTACRTVLDYTNPAGRTTGVLPANVGGSPAATPIAPLPVAVVPAVAAPAVPLPAAAVPAALLPAIAVPAVAVPASPLPAVAIPAAPAPPPPPGTADVQPLPPAAVAQLQHAAQALAVQSKPEAPSQQAVPQSATPSPVNRAANILPVPSAPPDNEERFDSYVFRDGVPITALAAPPASPSTQPKPVSTSAPVATASPQAPVVFPVRVVPIPVAPVALPVAPAAPIPVAPPIPAIPIPPIAADKPRESPKSEPSGEAPRVFADSPSIPPDDATPEPASLQAVAAECGSLSPEKQGQASRAAAEAPKEAGKTAEASPAAPKPSDKAEEGKASLKPLPAATPSPQVPAAIPDRPIARTPELGAPEANPTESAEATVPAQTPVEQRPAQQPTLPAQQPARPAAAGPRPEQNPRPPIRFVDDVNVVASSGTFPPYPVPANFRPEFVPNPVPADTQAPETVLSDPNRTLPGSLPNIRAPMPPVTTPAAETYVSAPIAASAKPPQAQAPAQAPRPAEALKPEPDFSPTVVLSPDQMAAVRAGAQQPVQPVPVAVAVPQARPVPVQPVPVAVAVPQARPSPPQAPRKALPPLDPTIEVDQQALAAARAAQQAAQSGQGPRPQSSRQPARPYRADSDPTLDFNTGRPVQRGQAAGPGGVPVAPVQPYPPYPSAPAPNRTVLYAACIVLLLGLCVGGIIWVSWFTNPEQENFRNISKAVAGGSTESMPLIERFVRDFPQSTHLAEVDELAWKKLVAGGPAKSYRWYLRVFAAGEHRKEADTFIVDKLGEMQISPTLEGLKEFLEDAPNDHLTREAERMKNELEKDLKKEKRP